MNSQSERILIFGPSRGLGAAVTDQLQLKELLLISRTMSAVVKKPGVNHILDLDLSRKPDQERALEASLKFTPNRVFYFAGGGPYGRFADKNWRDHQWAFEVNFLFPAQLIHSFLHSQQSPQIIVTGSAIAENKPDTNAASYSTAKHSLVALMQNLWHEQVAADLRIFSPTYMDTALLPRNAHVREKEKILDPKVVAKTFLDWAFDPAGSRHKKLES